MNVMTTDPKCTDYVYPANSPSRKCNRPAKYQYQDVAGRISYLCGIHAKHYKDSPALTPIETEEKKK